MPSTLMALQPDEVEPAQEIGAPGTAGQRADAAPVLLDPLRDARGQAT
ncbi:MAG: hypothetical protein U1F06_09340 [Steroidobacteraceae bacterium]